MVAEVPPRVSPGLRWLGALAVAAAPLVAVAVTYRLWRDRLPDPMPSHWGRAGQVDATTSLTGLVTVLAVIAAAGLLVAVVGAAVAATGHDLRRWLVAGGAGLGALGGGVWLMTAPLALDAADAHQARSPTWHLVAFTVALLGLPAAAFVACPPPSRPAAGGRPAPGTPRLDLGPAERAVYREVSQPGRGPRLVLVLALLPAVPLAGWASPWAAAPLVLVIAMTYLFLTVRLTVDARGLRAGFGPWGWPRLSVPLREIANAETTTVRPMEWGGWGYRIRPDGARGLIMRRGPAVRLELSGDRTMVISVRAAEPVAGLVNTLIDRDRR